jgi:ABC-type oligopeptide transport system substrate-binding subunit
MEWGEYLDEVHSHPPPLWFMRWIPDYPDPDSYLRVPVREQTAWRHPGYAQLLERALEVTDQQQRMRLYSQADRILVREAPIVPLSYSQLPMLIKPWVRRYSCHAFSQYNWKDVILDPH